MDIGKKIKALRSAKLMTQSELAGSEITRNMLSRIENGSALPSLPTLLYLADRLGVPAGFLLADSEDEFLYRKMTELPDIQRAYRAGDWDICRDLCEALKGKDDETEYLMLMCDFNSARDQFNSGDLRRAGALFDTICRNNTDVGVAYPPEYVRQISRVYLAYMREISPSFYSDEAASPIPLATLSDPFCRYCSVFISLNSQGTESEVKSVIDPSVYIDTRESNDAAFSRANSNPHTYTLPYS